MILRSELTETSSPFNNLINSFKVKGYKRFLFLEQRGFQTKEVNIMESLRHEQLKDIMTYVAHIPDGSVLSKTQPIIDGNNITIPAGCVIYANGYIVSVEEDAEVTITGSGNEYIGCTFTENAYTSTDDDFLKDPGTTFTDPESHIVIGDPPNKNRPGAYAIRVDVTFSAGSGEYVLWRFNNGVLLNPESPSVGINRDLLEVYIRDICGDCTDAPVKCYVKEDDNDNGTVVINSNIYYVWGKRYPRIQDEKISVPLAKEYEFCNNESHQYHAETLEYEVNERPIRDTDDMSFTVEGYLAMTRGNIVDTSDVICTGTTSGNPLAKMIPQSYGQLLEILEVYTTTNGQYNGTHDIDYIVTTDYYQDGNDINWSPGGNEPAGGSSYFVHVKVNITGVKATRVKHSITDEEVAIGGNTTVDLAHNDIFGLEDSDGIARVLVGDTEGGDDYTEGTDFEIINHLDDGYTNANSDPRQAWTESDFAQIHWLTTPPAGTVYISYGYWQHTKEGHFIARDSFDEQYEPAINQENLTTGKNTGYRNYISFNTASEEKPVNHTYFQLDYNVYRSRKDILEMMWDGNFNRVSGTSAEDSKFPEGHINGLTICKFLLPPDSPDITINNCDVSAKKQTDIRSLGKDVVEVQERVEEIILKLDSEAKMSRVDAEKGRWLEGFRDIRPSLNGGDISFNKSGLEFACRYDVHNGEGTLPFSNVTNTTLVPNIGASTVTIGHRFASLQRTLKSVELTPNSLKQLLATDSIRANPYTMFEDMGPFIQLEPNQDNWIDTQITTVNANASSQNFSPTVHGTRTQIINDTLLQVWMNPQGSTTDVRNASTGQTQTFEEAIAFIRQRTVAITGSKFTPNIDNISLTFDDVTVLLTPTGTTQAGTNPGTVKANATGDFTATFVIPVNIPTGSKQVVATELSTNRKANTTYIASGILRRIIQTIFNPPVAPRENLNLNNNFRSSVDPVGQTFTPDADMDIGAIDLYFKQKDNSIGGFVMIKDVHDGDPASECIAFKEFSPAQVSTSNNSSVVSEFLLDDPLPVFSGVMSFIGCGSKSNIYELYYAKGGGTDLIDTNIKVSENAYKNGNLFSSSDAQTWTVDQVSDLKFVLRPFVYNSSGVLEFNNTIANCTSFIVCADYLLRAGNRIIWQYSTDNGATWKGFQPNQVTKLSAIASQIKIKAEFSSTDAYTSPLLINDVTLQTRMNNSSGKYIGRNIHNQVGNEYYRMHVCYEAAIPGGTTIVVYASKDDGTTWDVIGSPTQSLQVDGEYTKYWKDFDWVLPPPGLAANDLSETGGGTLAENTYYYKLAATNASGETLPSTERQISVTGSNNSVTFDLTDVWPTGATGGRLYRSVSSGTETLKYIITGTPISFVDNGSDPDASSSTPKAVSTARDYQDDARIRFDLSTGDAAIEPKIRNTYFVEE